MNIFQQGVLPPVNFVDLDASMQSSILAPAGARTVAFADLAATVANSQLSPAGTRQITGADVARTFTSALMGSNTTVTSADTQLVTSGSLNVLTGDLIVCEYIALLNKGTTGGNCSLSMNKSAGTSTILLSNGQTTLNLDTRGVLASESYRVQGSTLVRVTASGTLTLRLSAVSLGSDSTASSGNCGFLIRVI